MRVSIFPRKLRDWIVASAGGVIDVAASGSRPDLLAWSEIKRRDGNEFDDNSSTDTPSPASATTVAPSSTDPLLSVGLPLGGLLGGGNSAPATTSSIATSSSVDATPSIQAPPPPPPPPTPISSIPPISTTSLPPTTLVTSSISTPPPTIAATTSQTAPSSTISTTISSPPVAATITASSTTTPIAQSEVVPASSDASTSTFTSMVSGSSSSFTKTQPVQTPAQASPIGSNSNTISETAPSSGSASTTTIAISIIVIVAGVLGIATASYFLTRRYLRNRRIAKAESPPPSPLLKPINSPLQPPPSATGEIPRDGSFWGSSQASISERDVGTESGYLTPLSPLPPMPKGNGSSGGFSLFPHDGGEKKDASRNF